MIRVDVLPKQSDFAHAALNQIACFVDDTRCRATDFGAARVGHYAKGTKLITPLLYRKKRGRATLCLWPVLQALKLIFFGKISVEGLVSAAHL